MIIISKMTHHIIKKHTLHLSNNISHNHAIRTFFSESKTYRTKRLLSLLEVVLSSESTCTVNNLDKVLVGYSKHIDLLVRNEGKKKALETLKGYHLIAINIAFGRPFKPIAFRKSDKKRRPRVLKPLLPLLTGDHGMKRIALTITKLYLEIHLPPNLDTESITTPCTKPVEQWIEREK
jgi:hypothetical protein